MVYVLFTITITVISHHYCSLILNPQTRPPLSPNSYTFLGGRPLVHRAGENRETEPPPLCKKKTPVLITRYTSQFSFPSLTHPPSPHPIPLSTLSHKKTIPNHAALLHNLLLQRRRRNRKNSPRNSRLGDYCDWILSTTAATYAYEYAYAYAYAYAGAYAGARTDRNVD